MRSGNAGEDPRQIYSGNQTVYIVKNRNKQRCLEEAVDKSGFFTHLDDRYKDWKKSDNKEDPFHIAIKPNFMCPGYETDIAVYTDPELVEYLVEMIRTHKDDDNKLIYKDIPISVVESQMVWSLVRHGHTVHSVADMVGYDSSKGYDIVDMTVGAEKFDYHDGVLDQDFIHPVWRDAHYRISFAKNKTHYQCYYTGCMKNVYGCLPQKNKLRLYHKGLGKRDREFDLATIAILEAFPVDFAFLDAYVSSDGIAGVMKDSWPKGTHTIMCGQSCFAVDWVQGAKMRLNPRKNYVILSALKKWGEPTITAKETRRRRDFEEEFPKANHDSGWDPKKWDPDKNLERWVPWENVPPFLDTITYVLQRSYNFYLFGLFVVGYRMDPRFPLVDNCMSILSAPLRKLVEWLDLHEDLIYPILVILDSALIIALIVVLFVVGCRS